MGRYYNQDEIDKWRKQSGFTRTSDVIAAEREARNGGAPQARVISEQEAERLMAEGVSGGAGGNRMDRVVQLLESIDRKLDNLGVIG